MLGDVLFELGDPEHAETVLADAAESAVTEQDKLAITFARTFNLFWALARTEDALAVNDAARAGVTSTVGLRMLRHNEGSMRVPEGDPRGLALLADLESDIHDAVAPVAWLTGAMMKPVGLVTAGRTVDAVASARHAYDSHVEVDHRTLYPHPAAQLVSVVGALAHAGRLGEARAVGERGHAELTAAHVPVTAMWMAMLLGHVEWYAGHPVSGRRWFAEAIALARKYRHVRPLQTRAERSGGVRGPPW